MALALLLIINTPSIKLFTGPTSVVNVVAILALVVRGGRRYLDSQWSLSVRDSIVIGLLGLSSVLMVLPGYLGFGGAVRTAPLDIMSLLFILVVVTVILGTVTADDVVWYSVLQVGWAVVVSLGYLLEVYSLGALPDSFHYNTVVLPIALALCSVIAYLIHPQSSFSRRSLAAIGVSSVVMLMTVVSLHSRGIYIGVIGATVLGVGLILWQSSRDVAISALKRAFAAIVFALVVVGVLISQGVMSTIILDRMASLVYNFENAERIDLYTTAVNMVVENPLGNGLGAYAQTTGAVYPHNMILQAAVAGGIVAALLFASAIILLCVGYLQDISTELSERTLAIGMITAYLLFIFSISYSITHTYILFAALCSATKMNREVAISPRKRAQRLTTSWKHRL
ncbi:hypothetical protein GWG54_12185 [Natronococcus sp. JC468]|uniref:O-antigen ligase family protein n=1 Tax=Natronococcus sp. JC468 TaxID=1961921 RepID=UPI00143A81BD|nr:O-antigen ligase family protein [Natronococcus sp. JC468]NKE36564.1 hypothetical protein [Natronococcus sp. JC468]